MRRKLFKAIFCLLCAAVMLVPTLPGANASGIELTLGGSRTVYLAAGESVSHTFTPDVSGSYAFWAANDTEMGYEAVKMDVYAADGSGQPRNDRFSHAGVQGMLCELEAGVTYCFDLWWDLHGYGYTYTYGVEEASSTTGISFAPSYRSDYEGDEWKLYPVLSSPGAVLNDISWNSSDPSVVSVEKDGMSGAWVRLKKAGTAVITATAGGISGSCTIEVLPPYELKMGEAITISHPTEGGWDFSFTPEASGRYVIYANHQIPVNLTTSGVSGDSCFFGNCQGTSADLQAGKKYSLSVFVPLEPPIQTLVMRVIPYDEWEAKMASGLDPELWYQDSFLEPERWYTECCEPGEVLFTEQFFVTDEAGEYYLTVVGGLPEQWIIDPEIPELERFADSENGILQLKLNISPNTSFCLVYPGEELTAPLEVSFLLSREKPDISRWQGSEPESAPEEEPEGSGGPDSGETGTVILDVETLLEHVTNAEVGGTVEVQAGMTEVTIPDGSVFSESSSRGLTVVLSMDSGRVALDSVTQAKIFERAMEGETTVTLSEVEAEALSSAQRAVLNDPGILGGTAERILEASILCGGDYLHDFEGGTATVTVSCLDPEKEYAVCYIDAGGGVEAVPCTGENGVVTFTVEHFSVFVVVALQARENLLEEQPGQSADPVPSAGVTAAVSGIVTAAVITAVIILIVRKKKSTPD